jgi:hypothetical protein
VGSSGFGGFVGDLIAANIGEADRIQDVDAINEPANLRFPVVITS